MRVTVLTILLTSGIRCILSSNKIADSASSFSGSWAVNPFFSFSFCNFFVCLGSLFNLGVVLFQLLLSQFFYCGQVLLSFSFLRLSMLDFYFIFVDTLAILLFIEKKGRRPDCSACQCDQILALSIRQMNAYKSARSGHTAARSLMHPPSNTSLQETSIELKQNGPVGSGPGASRDRDMDFFRRLNTKLRNQLLNRCNLHILSS